MSNTHINAVKHVLSYAPALFVLLIMFAFPVTIFGQEASTLFIVVENPDDCRCVQRLAGSLAEVKVVALTEQASPRHNQDCICAQSLVDRNIDLYLVRVGTDCSTACMWRERLFKAHPETQFVKLSLQESNTGDRECCATRTARLIHRSLTEKMPDHAEELEANMHREMRRIRALKQNLPRVAIAGELETITDKNAAGLNLAVR